MNKEEIQELSRDITKLEVMVQQLKAEIVRAIAHTEARFERVFTKKDTYVV